MNVIRFLQRKTDCSVLYDYKTFRQALRFMRGHGKQEMPLVSHEGCGRATFCGTCWTTAATRR